MSRDGSISPRSAPSKLAGKLWPARAWAIVWIAVGFFLSLCFATYYPADIPLLSSHPQHPTGNLGGTIGAWLAFVGRGGFGWAAFLLPFLCWLLARRWWRGEHIQARWTTLLLAMVSLMSSLAVLASLGVRAEAAQAELGGMVGFLFARAGRYYLGHAGTILTATCIALLSWFVVSGQMLRLTASGVASGLKSLFGMWARRPAPAGMSALPSSPTVAVRAREDAANGGEEAAPRVRIRSTIEPKPKTIPTPPRRQAPGGFQLPSLEFLTNPPPISERQMSEDLQLNARVLEETLREFGIEASVVNIDRGPSVTRYELTPAPGVKLTKIVSLADDLALVMKAANCHVVAPIPGKGRVGIDVPNGSTTMVYLKEIITAHEFAGNPSPVALPIGKDVSGNAIVTDLRECPHLLIAGATGSGKTVCLNSLLVGMLCHASPEQVKFLMIDPKMVELALFNDIPHLVAPVVTNAKKASVALHWAVQEMERRYQLLAKAGVRNIDLYNKRLASGALKPAPGPEDDPPTRRVPGAGPSGARLLSAISDEWGDDGRPLPYLVIVIDELADLMMVASQDVESAITRLAQLSRAVGIHIILATQRPSVDVITGVIKANFPARIAFQVASKVDSRTILRSEERR